MVVVDVAVDEVSVVGWMVLVDVVVDEMSGMVVVGVVVCVV